MRRKEKEITDQSEIDAIIRRSQVCRLGLVDEGLAYIVPLCFGYADNALFFHSATEGRKIEILRRNNQVCFEIDSQKEIVNTGIPCDWKNSYESVIGFGIASVVEDHDEKIFGLNVLVNHYAPGISYEFPGKNVKRTTVIKIEISEMTGKRSV